MQIFLLFILWRVHIFFNIKEDLISWEKYIEFLPRGKKKKKRENEKVVGSWDNGGVY